VGIRQEIELKDNAPPAPYDCSDSDGDHATDAEEKVKVVSEVKN
jgi:hypothetical protein